MESALLSQYSPDRIEMPIALVTEGNDIIRNQIAGHLSRKGYRVLEAKTSIEALLLAVDYPDHIDALYTSLELRKYCNGAELASCLKAMQPEMSVFYLGHAEEAMEMVIADPVRGDSALLAKPLTARHLDEAIAMVM